MFDLAAARTVTARELNELIDIAAGLDLGGWSTQTRCEGWTVRELCAHAGAAARQQAEGFRRARAGRLEPPEGPGAPDLTSDEVLDLLRSGAAELDAALGDIDDTTMAGMTPLPFGVLPTMIAIHLPVFEYAFHRDDLASAVGARRGLADDVAATMIEFFPGLAPALAGRAASGSAAHAYRLTAPAGAMTLAPSGSTWAVIDGEPELPLCSISGSNEAVALFAMGRIGADDPRLDITGPAASAANEFKRWIPGP